ncbi:hypothetical protein PEPS_21760 [Persicobacter psychrovividus]|uniref:Uncharacterized protein n=1 Tax=Persicobacter psychrovividus TaxID=387638 RepID=A0ABM7VG08_9BACT|nr:hypothetical protein PEPS_21760 [Persicobacter psychrovividus]
MDGVHDLLWCFEWRTPRLVTFSFETPTGSAVPTATSRNATQIHTCYSSSPEAFNQIKGTKLL